MMTTAARLKELKEKATSEIHGFVLFPEYEINEGHGNTIIMQDFGRVDHINKRGHFDVNGEFENWVKINWWDGNNTQERYAHEDECEYRDLKFLGDEKIIESGTFEAYESFYIDVDSDEFFVKYSDNNQQCMKQCLTQINIEEID
jgi:hypothetical protein